MDDFSTGGSSSDSESLLSLSVSSLSSLSSVFPSSSDPASDFRSIKCVAGLRVGLKRSNGNLMSHLFKGISHIPYASIHLNAPYCPPPTP